VACSHGWSGGAAQPADAEPVGACFNSYRPEGAEDRLDVVFPPPRWGGICSFPCSTGSVRLRRTPPVATTLRPVGAVRLCRQNRHGPRHFFQHFAASTGGTIKRRFSGGANGGLGMYHRHHDVIPRLHHRLGERSPSRVSSEPLGVTWCHRFESQIGNARRRARPLPCGRGSEL